MNSDWPRWIKSSVAEHLAKLLDNAYLVVDGEKLPAILPNTRYEFRLNGPNVRECSKGEFQLNYDFNLLIISASNESDIYKIERLKGTGINSFCVSIPVFKYGTGTNDDQSQLGCLTRKSDISIRDFNFSGETVQHVAIDAEYKFEAIESKSTYEEALAIEVQQSLEDS
jgi:hypothetical protein